MQRQVGETHVDQESEAGVDFLEDRIGDDPISRAYLEFGEEYRRLGDRDRRHVVDALVAHSYRQGERLEPGSLAGGAWHLSHVPLELLALALGFCVCVAALDPGNGPLE